MTMRLPASHTLAVAAAVLTSALTAAAVALFVLLLTDARYASTNSWSSTIPDMAMTLAYALVGVVVTTKRPSNLVGWALVLAGDGMLFGGLLDAYAELALLMKPELGLPGGAAAAALSSGLWTALMAGVFLLLVTFPAGTLASTRIRRWVLWSSQGSRSSGS